MRPHRPLRTLLAAMLLMSMPVVVSAQDGSASPEGAEWHLTAYLGSTGSGEFLTVPLGVDATLLLESGVASGSGGCNTLSGSYQLDGSGLSFDGDMTVTLSMCEGDVQSVEEAYLAWLPQVASWSILDSMLQLIDDSGGVILAFEQATESLTKSDVAAIVAAMAGLQAQADTLRKELDSQNVGKLRRRIVDLEAEVKDLKDQAGTPKSASSGKPRSTTLTAAEKVLRAGVASRIRSTCVPRRTELPAGTIAALQCQPKSALVRDMAYYLMREKGASAVFEERMTQNGVPDQGGAVRCSDGVATATHWIGGGPASEGCYIDDNGRASLRFLEFATDCKALRVGGQRLATPTIYIAVLAEGDDIGKVADWATNGGKARPSTLTQTIKRPEGARSPACPT